MGPLYTTQRFYNINFAPSPLPPPMKDADWTPSLDTWELEKRIIELEKRLEEKTNDLYNLIIELIKDRDV